MGCKDRAGTADRVRAAAGTLADLQAHVADYPLAGTGREWATERARVLTAAHLAVMAPVLEALERLEKPRWKYPEAAAQMRAMAEAEDAAAEQTHGCIEAEGVKVGDCFRVAAEQSLAGHRGEVGEVVWMIPPVARLQGKGWRWSGDSAALLDPKLFERVRAVEVPPRHEPDGNERLATAEELAVPARKNPLSSIRAVCRCPHDHEAVRLWCERPTGHEGDHANRGVTWAVGAIRAPGEHGTAWGGMEPEDSGVSDLDGPAGEELPFAEQREDRRAQAHAASVAASGLRAEVEALVLAWRSYGDGDTFVAGDVSNAVARLAARAGLL